MDGAGLEEHHAEGHQERQKPLRVENIGFARPVSDRRGEITFQAQPDKPFNELVSSEQGWVSCEEEFTAMLDFRKGGNAEYPEKRAAYKVRRG